MTGLIIFAMIVCCTIGALLGERRGGTKIEGFW